MRHWWMIAALMVCMTGAWAQDADGDGLPDTVEERLGTDPGVAEEFVRVHDDKAKGDGDTSVGAELEVAHDLVAVYFASVARGRSLWRLQFTEPWEVRGDVALIIYIDADGDLESGRQGGGVQGADVMLRLGSISNHGLAATVLQAFAAHGDSLYLTLDAPVNVEDGEVVLRAYGLIQNRENTSDQDRTPWFEVRAPASEASPVAVPEGHSLYRPPEAIERIRARVPVDAGGTRAIVTWITSWPTGSLLQYGLGADYTETVRLDEPEQNHRVALDGLRPDATYRYRIRARGGMGDLISGEEMTFSTEVREPIGSVASERVPLRVTGASGDRLPVSQGVPFPQGALGSADHVRVLDTAGVEVPAQIEVTSRWPDGTVKWILLDFQADLPSAGEAAYTFEFGAEVTRALVPDPIQVTEAEDAITVNTGVLRARFSRTDFRLLGEVCMDLDGDGRIADDERVTEPDGSGIFLTALDGEQFTSLGAPELLEVIRRGPLHTVVFARGHHLSEAGEPLFIYEVRLHFYAGLPTVRVFHSFENDEVDEQFTTIGSLELRLPLAGAGAGASLLLPGGETVALDAGQSARVLQVDDTECRTEGVETTIAEPQRAPGVVNLIGERGGIVVAMRNFWKLWPKGIGTDEAGVRVGIMPDLPADEYTDIDRELEDRLYFAMVDGVYKLHRGVAKTHEMLVGFYSSTDRDISDRWLAARCNTPPVAVCSSRWYCSSGVFWHITPRVAGEFDRYERLVDEILAAFLRNREQRREYGMLNFGDWWGERGFNWGNIEYDTQHGMMMQFARTGDRAWFEGAMWAARHNLDVDMIHHAAAGQKVGVPYCHCMCHTGDYYPRAYRPTGISGGGSNSGHLWTRGNLEYALMTGDDRAMRVALGTADWLAGDHMVGYRMNKGAERATAWPLFGVMAAYHVTADEYYLNAAHIITREVIREQNPDKGHWDIPAGYSKVRPMPVGGYAWCAGLLLTSMEMANEYLRDPELDRTYVKAAEWLAREEWIPERKGFRSTSCDSVNSAVTPGFECNRTPAAMLHAYELTGDRKFLDIAHVGFSYAVGRGGGGGKGGSTQLTLTPHAVHKLKAAGITSLDTSRWEGEVRLRAPGWLPVEPGQAVSLPVTVTSNRDRPLTVELRLEALPEGWLPRAPRSIELAAGASGTAHFEFPHAAAMKPGALVALTLVAEPEGGDQMRHQVLLTSPAEGLAGNVVGLVAGAGDFLGPALERAGVGVRAIETLDDLSSFGVIFLGTQAHSIDAAGLRGDYARVLAWVNDGGTLVISQINDDGWRPEFLPGTVVLEETNAASGAIVVPGHPIFTSPAEVTDVAGMSMYDTITQADGWEVLVEDTAGRPAILTTDLGGGRILAFMPSVERYYTGDAAADDAAHTANYCRLFGNIIAWALAGAR